jgi:hypothetical protein
LLVLLCVLPSSPSRAEEGGGLVDFNPNFLTETRTKAGAKKKREIYVSVWYSPKSGRYAYARAITIEIANAQARKKCGGYECGLVGWVKNQCVAFAVGDGKSYGYGFSSTRHGANKIAKEKCSTVDYDCNVYVSSCAEGAG